MRENLILNCTAAFDIKLKIIFCANSFANKWTKCETWKSGNKNFTKEKERKTRRRKQTTKQSETRNSSTAKASKNFLHRTHCVRYSSEIVSYSLEVRMHCETSSPLSLSLSCTHNEYAGNVKMLDVRSECKKNWRKLYTRGIIVYGINEIQRSMHEGVARK